MKTQNSLTESLQSTFTPSHLQLENESHQHSGYVEGKESHFKLTIVSDHFLNKRLVQRHQQIYACVANLLTSGGGSVHALAIHAYTPTEWQEQQVAPNSPQCASKK